MTKVPNDKEKLQKISTGLVGCVHERYGRQTDIQTTDGRAIALQRTWTSVHVRYEVHFR